MNTINKRLLPVILFMLLLISGCSKNTKNDSAKINALNEGLKISNSLIHDQTSGVYVTLKEKLESYGTADKAAIWYPKALAIKMYSDSMINFIEGLKTYLGKEKIEEDVVGLLFETKKMGNELYDMLLAYKNSILKIDPEIERIFKDNIIVITEPLDSLNPGQKNFTKIFFHDTSKEMALSILSRLENNIHIAELETITFCNFKVNNDYDGIRMLSPLIAQSTTHARPGEFIEISAGVGAFSAECKPHIKINGIPVMVTDGVGNYHLQASDKPGKHFIQVTIDYINDDGKNVSCTKNVHYSTD